MCSIGQSCILVVIRIWLKEARREKILVILEPPKRCNLSPFLLDSPKDPLCAIETRRLEFLIGSCRWRFSGYLYKYIFQLCPLWFVLGWVRFNWAKLRSRNQIYNEQLPWKRPRQHWCISCAIVQSWNTRDIQAIRSIQIFDLFVHRKLASSLGGSSFLKSLACKLALRNSDNIQCKLTPQAGEASLTHNLYHQQQLYKIFGCTNQSNGLVCWQQPEQWIALQSLMLSEASYLFIFHSLSTWRRNANEQTWSMVWIYISSFLPLMGIV